MVKNKAKLILKTIESCPKTWCSAVRLKKKTKLSFKQIHEIIQEIDSVIQINDNRLIWAWHQGKSRYDDAYYVYTTVKRYNKDTTWWEGFLDSSTARFNFIGRKDNVE